MRTTTVAEENQSASLTPELRPSMPWRVATVVGLQDYRFSVTFVDGLSGLVDMSALIVSPEAGVFSVLHDRALFAQIHVEHGAVTWPGELDLAPDAMHATIKEHGEWTLS